MTTPTAVTKTCECGATYDVDPGGLSPRFAGLLLSVTRMCPDCARQRRDAAEAEARARQEAAAASQRARWVRDSGIPASLGAGPLAVSSRVAHQAATAWADAKGPHILVLTGPVGVGKTTLAAAAFRRRLQRRPGYWRTVPVLFAHLSAGFGSPRHDSAIALLDGSYLLALDDLDKVRPTEYAAERLFAAIDGCWAGQTPLIITTNLNLVELGEKWPEPYGEAIISRLTDRTNAVVIQMDGDDRRQEQAA